MRGGDLPGAGRVRRSAAAGMVWQERGLSFSAVVSKLRRGQVTDGTGGAQDRT
jgi:hypothetical protein